jgi:hypothetical protein
LHCTIDRYSSRGIFKLLLDGMLRNSQQQQQQQQWQLASSFVMISFVWVMPAAPRVAAPWTEVAAV